MTENSDTENQSSNARRESVSTAHLNTLSHHPTWPFVAGFAATVLVSSTLIFTWAHASTDAKPHAASVATAPSTAPTEGSTATATSGDATTAAAAAKNDDGSGTPPAAGLTPTEEKTKCLDIVAHAVRDNNRQRLQQYCSHTARLPACMSVENRPIAHLDSLSDAPKGKRVLVFGLIHGDENLAGEMTLEWAERLLKIPHRNSWRVVGLLNPDGLYHRTRMNAHGVDLNRNFPTKDWPDEAQKYWSAAAKNDPRRFPGDAAASEPETKCAVAQIKDFKPDFIISVHTPYHVLDFDGPKLSFPAYRDLPWRALGNYPGSLGRFMWKDFSVPVLTVELGQKMVDAAQLQDIVGGLAIEASNKSGAKTVSTYETL